MNEINVFFLISVLDEKEAISKYGFHFLAVDEASFFLYFFQMITLVRSVKSEKHNNTSVCDKIMKLGTHVQDDIRNKTFNRDTPKCHVFADVSTFFA